MIGLLALGSLGFLVLVGVITVLLFVMVEYEKPALATFSLIVTFVALAYLGDFNLLHVVRANPMQTLGALAGYFAAGAFWSVGKWWFYVRNLREKYDDLKEEFFRTNTGRYGIPSGMTRRDAMPDDAKATFQQFLLNYYPHNGEKVWLRPQVRKNKSRIMTWMMYWPWSMTWTLISDPVKRMFKAIFQWLRSIYEAIANRLYRGVEDDLPAPRNG